MVLSVGSTGDVEPFVALSVRLKERGHDVWLAADAGFESLAPGKGVEFTPIRADFQSLLPTAEGKRPSVRNDVLPVIRGMLEDSWAVAHASRPQVIVAHEKTQSAPHIAEKLRIPYVQALTVPMLTPTREFPLPAMIRHNLGGLLNRASYRLVGLLSRPYAGLIRVWRADSLGLDPRGKAPKPARTLYCYSPSLVPTPRDWPPDAVATGYWLRDGGGEEAVDPKLESFVAADPPAIYVGFGSSVGPDPARLGAAIAQAIRELDVTNLRQSEQTLSALEEKLIALLKVACADEVMFETRREVDSELNPFRSRMTGEQLTMLEQQMWRRKLMERFEVPRLSLFYLI